MWLCLLLPFTSSEDNMSHHNEGKYITDEGNKKEMQKFGLSEKNSQIFTLQRPR